MRRAARLAAIAWLLFSTSASAQEPVDFKELAKETLEEAPYAAASPELQNAAVAYQIASLKHRQAVFAWQLTTTRIIFWMVLALVLSGVAFSAIQFAVALRRKSDFNDAEIAMGVEGVKVRSQFLGIITLALSLGFFYLYLKTVYPISQVPEAAAAQSAPAKR